MISKNTAKAENYYIGALGSLCRSTALKKKKMCLRMFLREEGPVDDSVNAFATQAEEP